MGDCVYLQATVQKLRKLFVFAERFFNFNATLRCSCSVQGRGTPGESPTSSPWRRVLAAAASAACTVFYTCYRNMHMWVLQPRQADQPAKAKQYC